MKYFRCYEHYFSDPHLPTTQAVNMPSYWFNIPAKQSHYLAKVQSPQRGVYPLAEMCCLPLTHLSFMDEPWITPGWQVWRILAHVAFFGLHGWDMITFHNHNSPNLSRRFRSLFMDATTFNLARLPSLDLRTHSKEGTDSDRSIELRVRCGTCSHFSTLFSVV